MSSIALASPRHDIGTVQSVANGFVRWRRLIAGFAVGFPVFFYLLLVAIPIVRYGHLPNYLTTYDWFGNVARIVRSTPSVSDMVPIILNEWLLEFGYMDMNYGHGIAEWSMSFVPHKIALVSLTGALLGLNLGLMFDRNQTGTVTQECLRAGRSGLLTGAGALCAGLTNATLFAVSCCSAPSWVGSFAILGIETSSAFALEPYGPAGTLAGVAMLVISALWLARENRANAVSLQTAEQVP